MSEQSEKANRIANENARLREILNSYGEIEPLALETQSQGREDLKSLLAECRDATWTLRDAVYMPYPNSTGPDEILAPSPMVAERIVYPTVYYARKRVPVVILWNDAPNSAMVPENEHAMAIHDAWLRANTRLPFRVGLRSPGRVPRPYSPLSHKSPKRRLWNWLRMRVQQWLRVRHRNLRLPKLYDHPHSAARRDVKP